VIVIINGPCGIGKTSVAWELNARFHRSVMLDGDYVGAVRPFEIYDDERVEYLYRTLRHLVTWHVGQDGYPNFVINYVFESPQSLARLKGMLEGLAGPIVAFRLLAEAEEIEARIRKRDEDPEWYLNRYEELVAVQKAAARRGDMGTPLDTTGLGVDEVVDAIWARLSPQARLPHPEG
jgi:hypothetical protein